MLFFGIDNSKTHQNAVNSKSVKNVLDSRTGNALRLYIEIISKCLNYFRNEKTKFIMKMAKNYS